MFGRFLTCISQVWDVLCESMSWTSSQTPSTPALESVASTTNSQTPSTCDFDQMASTASQIQSTSVSYSMASTTSQTTSLLASTSLPTRWDVFLSFRGIDTRYTFTDHLRHALLNHGIQTFMDDPELRSGEVISDSLLQAIQDANSYVVVLSQNYASSTWCLDELVEILKCHNKMGRLVIPVFYNILPCVVRHQTDSFKEAFEKLEKRFAGTKEKVNRWRSTLKDVADISGETISAKRSEADIINKIVNDLLNVNPKTLYVTKYPVGLDSRIKDMTSLLRSSTERVTKVGIFGMGGVGKTTLAKAVFNQLLQEKSFKGGCFLAKVAEVSRTFKGLESLQQQLINDVLKTQKNVEVKNVDEGTKFIRDKLQLQMVLVVIDDLDNQTQFESLVGQFASGSVVIITTRDEQVLETIDTTYRHPLNGLDDAESQTLFFQHAFGNAEPDNTKKELSKDILRHASGLPLALEVFGSYLYKKPVVKWRSYIEKLQRIPESNIVKRLTVSLDASELDDPLLKKIFIDIACLFIGWDIRLVVKTLETYYPYADDKLDILKKRCLLTIDENHKLGMHDLLRDIGRKLACNNCPDEPEKHSRLWKIEDIFSVFKKQEETQAIECAIECIIPGSYRYIDAPFPAEALKKMRKLRFLDLGRISFTGNFEQTFEDLRWLSWFQCPLKCLPSKFYPKKLVVLNLRESRMTTLWEPNMQVSHVFENLKSLDMSDSEELTETPDFTKLPRLETLYFRYCTSLKEVHISIVSLVRLVSLNLFQCKRLRSLPVTVGNLRALKILEIDGCRRLEELPIELGNIHGLKRSIFLDFRGFKNLRSLPDTICNMRDLETLDIKDCYKLEKLPDQLGKLINLKEVTLSECPLLLSIAELPPNLKSIMADNCTSLETLPDLSYLKQLEILYLTNCRCLTEIQGLEELVSIRELHLSGCNSNILTDHSIKRLIQIYSQFGHQIKIFIPSHLFPPLTRRYHQSSPCESLIRGESTFSFNLPQKILGMFLFFRGETIVFPNNGSGSTYSIKNTTSGSIWSDWLRNPYDESCMVIVPRSIFSVLDGDDKIEIAVSDSDFPGVHFFDRTDITSMTDDVVENPATSFDDLELFDHELQDIFLDIACFFNKGDFDEAVQIMETYYSNVDCNIRILLEKCLLTPNYESESWMYDWAQDMGRKLARNNSPIQLENHTRLWSSVDIYAVLKKQKGTEATKSIIPGDLHIKTNPLVGACFTTESFKKMSKLRFLCLPKVYLTGSFEQTFEDLRWLRWIKCPLECFPSDFNPQKLVILELPRSSMKSLWELNNVSHVFENLKTLKMPYSLDLTTTPDFDMLPCLETLDFVGCRSLEEVHISIGKSASLVSINLHHCVKLRRLPDTICNLRALEVLDIHDCSSLEALPMALGNIKSLRELNMKRLLISKLPDSIGHLSKLLELKLSYNENLETLPDTISNLRSLKTINISGCQKLEVLPVQLWQLTRLWKLRAESATLLRKLPDIESCHIASSLKELYLSGSGLTALPSNISQLSNLKYLDLQGCHHLKQITAYGCRSIEKLNLKKLEKLEELNLTNCSGLKDIEGLKQLTSLRELSLEGCRPSFLANIFTKHFFQIFCGFSHQIVIYIGPERFGDWMSQSSGDGSRMSLDLPPNVSHDYLGMILCFKFPEGPDCVVIDYSLKTSTSDFAGTHNASDHHESCMVIVPRSIFTVTEDDNAIELTVGGVAEILGIHLVYKDEGYEEESSRFSY